MTDQPAQSYLLGDSDPELQRLGVQHRVWAEATHASWRRAGIAAGAHVLDLGAGPGFTSLELAEFVGPEGRVLAVDQSQRFLDFLSAQCRVRGIGNVACRKARIEALELSDRFDAIYARWVFCFLGDPGAVVKLLRPLLKPGGRLITLDYFNYRAFCIAPRIPEMETIVAAIETSWADAGGSLEVQGSMGEYMVRAGMQVAEVRHVGGTVLPGTPLWEWPRSFLRAYLPQLIDNGYLEAGLVQRFWDEWERRIVAGGSYLCLPPLLEIHGRAPD